jgi:hypothetical protein
MYPEQLERASKTTTMVEVKTILKKETSSVPLPESEVEIKSTHRQPRWKNNSDAPSTPSTPSTASLDISGKPILYLSIDVETDGPVPGIYSMLSIGMAGFTTDNQVVWEREINLLPLENARVDQKTLEWWKKDEQKEAWNHLMTNRKKPEEAMVNLSEEIRELRTQYRVFTIAWPACFDWMFLHWYMHKFVGDNPLGRRAKCADTYAWAISRTIHPNISIGPLLEEWEDNRFTHTHKALDDAKEQGAKFVNMLKEMTRNGKDYRLCYDKRHKHGRKGKK